MTAQWILVALVALIAVAYLARQAWRSWTGGCGTSCGCSATKGEQPGLVSSDDLTARVRERQVRGG